MTDEKRKHKRLTIMMTRLALEDADGKTNVRSMGEINNISLGGIALETASHFDMGLTFKVSFTLPNGQEFKNMLGKVMWVSKNPEKNFVGIRFTRFDLFDRIKLAGCLLEIIQSNTIPDKMIRLRSLVKFFKKAEAVGPVDLRARIPITDAGLKIDFDRVYGLYEKLESASKTIKIAEFFKIVSTFSRINKLLPFEFDPGVVRPELFKFKEEIELFENIKNNEIKYFNAINTEAYEEAFILLLGLCQSLNGMADKMLASGTESDVTGKNRISLLYFASVLYSRIADIYNIMEH